MHALLKRWKNYIPKRAPYIFPGDEEQLCNSKSTCKFNGWGEFIGNPDFCAPSESKLHLGLLPMPFSGDLRTAKIYLLMLNPGLGPHDYYGEYCVKKYRTSLIDNLHQKRGRSFMFLDPALSWHGGFNYWNNKLNKVVDALAANCHISYREALIYVKSNIASLELLPYHSSSLKVPAKMMKNLESVKLMRSFVQEQLVPRAKAGECVLIATRAAKYWKLPKRCKTIIEYAAGEARAAHLTPNSKGGKAILEFLSQRYSVCK